MAINTKAYIQEFLKIRNKDFKIVPFVINAPQDKLYNAIRGQAAQGKPQRFIVLKARQMGFSTLTEAVIFKKTATAHNVRSGIVAHDADGTNNLFNMFNRFYDNLPPELQPAKLISNAKELVFNNKEKTGLDSSIRCMTAGAVSIGRSDTFQNLHISEYAFWTGEKKTTLNGLLQAVPNTPDTLVIIESTANGFDHFKDLWDMAIAGETDFVPIFCAWWELPDYSIPYTGFALTPDERELQELYSLTNDQLEWRRWCIKNNCMGDTDLFKQEYPSCAEEAFLHSGRPVFNTVTVVNRIQELEKQYKEKPYEAVTMKFEWQTPKYKDSILNDSIVAEKGDLIKVYERPQKGVPYVIGGDTKGEGSDYYTATVVNNITGNRCATLKMQVNNSEPYTHQLYALGMWYNEALIGIEMNFNTAPIEELQRLHYPRQFVRQAVDSYTKKYLEKFGWRTDGMTRPLIIDKYVSIVNDFTHLINDIDTLRECLTFIYDEKGRPDAMSGKHDDLLFSDMIANEIRGQQRFTGALESAQLVKWSPDLVEDYHNCKSEDGKRYLIEKYGQPSNLY